MSLQIDADFEGGNIEIVALDGDRADLAIRPDSGGPWTQWFSFRVRGAAGRALTLRIVSAGASSYPDGWEDYRARVSDDGAHWVLADTRFDGAVLEIRHTPRTGEARFAYFAPYELARHEALLTRIAAAPGVSRRTLGRSIDGRAIDVLEMGEGAKHVWVLGRQHSGETMASWWMEGALARLTDPAIRSPGGCAGGRAGQPGRGPPPPARRAALCAAPPRASTQTANGATPTPTTRRKSRRSFPP